MLISYQAFSLEAANACGKEEDTVSRAFLRVFFSTEVTFIAFPHSFTECKNVSLR